jgi:hypothetical protein
VQTLAKLVDQAPIVVPELALDDFQKRVREGLHLEFFLARGRLILTPHLAPLTTAEASAEELERLETILDEKQDELEQLKLHLLYDLSMYSALLETNSYHVAVNDHRVIARFLPYEPRAFEVKLYTQPPGDPVERYGDRIYLGRDRLPLDSSERPHLGLGYLRRSFPEQVDKLTARVARHAAPEQVALFEREFQGDLAELCADFRTRADAVLGGFPAVVSSATLAPERLLELNRAFREIKHVLAEAESVVRELEERLLAARSDAARYATKLRKDLTNDLNFIMMKVNGRISDAVNGIRI